ncbi:MULTISPECIES: hypothetical protein [unclassified Sporosarcina]|uniref:hypothetical protein n=1 Tax=unclassified Sporosarcina TaxID=2647733 RepID=UPI0020879DC3|nr:MULTISPECIES: hypothetical protein [unclassified Sporosarcina]GKV65254.1 hypothetical protein NCCP2331_14070 [Sporosarcina sp. NCCP-2331]GLB55378.1 hypothetical protein NCCP2378_11650 [Sporosarcina sp. NCCP-2378]
MKILAYEIFSSLGLDVAMNTLQKQKKHRHLLTNTFIHSDQGFHYTNPRYQAAVKKMGLGIDVT